MEGLGVILVYEELRADAPTYRLLGTSCRFLRDLSSKALQGRNNKARRDRCMQGRQGPNMLARPVRRIEGRQAQSRPDHRALDTLALLGPHSRLRRGRDMRAPLPRRTRGHLGLRSKGRPALQSLCSYRCFELKRGRWS